ncbi:MAG: GntR family transcriptional regulator [Paracoccus denitrificans]|uniref:GntR family transcriptional regulator n=1 Tax=Paracoccus denitrificans TaxID=266 RepID=A0A533HZL7_PARDE|nr:MAG: GntR family transcriptional regulator [Paracoccus denitrificans]
MVPQCRNMYSKRIFLLAADAPNRKEEQPGSKGIRMNYAANREHSLASAAEARNASERAYHELRTALIEGRLPRHHKLTEAGLATDLGLSRTPVREAISRLLMEGLLERRQGRGLWCALPDTAEIQEIFELRVRLEPYAAGQAALNATNEQIFALQKSADEMSALADMVGASDEIIARIDSENARFHGLILEATQSQRISQMVRLSTNIALVTRTFRSFTAEQRRRSAAHHREIASAISARAPRWAAGIMKVHILSAAESAEPFRTTPASEAPSPRSAEEEG